MREIKFRAWDPINSEMWAFVYPTWNGNVEGKKVLLPHTYTDIELMPTDGDDQPIVLQYTGYKDASEESIPVYDGDILEWYEGIFGVRKVGAVEWPESHKSEPGWRVSNSSMGFGYLFNECAPVVIGNIYENPELLEDAS